jgi:bifunctional DNase/RNase
MHNMLQIDIASLAYNMETQQPVLLLKLAGSPDPAERIVPLTLGHPEAKAIIAAVNGMATSRPQTHDLLVSVMQASGLELKRAEIGSFKQGTFFATLEFTRNNERVTMDARPSDAIALALRTQAPLFIADDVYQETSVRTHFGGQTDSEMPQQALNMKAMFDDFHEFIEQVEPGDFN